MKDFIGLINNAGIGKELPLEVQRIESMQKVFDVNEFGVVSLTQAFVPFLRKSQGRIVNVGSVAGKVVAPMKGTYAASKHALEALNDAMRVELGHWGISVSLIQPAYAKTRIAAKQTGKTPPFDRCRRRTRVVRAHFRHVRSTSSSCGKSSGLAPSDDRRNPTCAYERIPEDAVICCERPRCLRVFS